MKEKFVYFFEKGNADGDKSMRDILGGKGANLAEMSGIGLPVPPGFTVSTEVCTRFFTSGNRIPQDVEEEILENLTKLVDLSGQSFGDENNPLLVSVRSGAKFSMPGMMDTILNLGLNDTTVQGLARKSNNKRFAFDCYRRLIHMFGDVVMGVSKKSFENILRNLKAETNTSSDAQLNEDSLEKLIRSYKDLVQQKAERSFPQDVKDQLFMAISSVFESWNTPRAVTYRRLNHIPEDLGTAVNIQLMVFGNFGETSATGVGFTRNPSDGSKEIYGEYLTNAQGEDVVAGIRTPFPLKHLADDMPVIYKELTDITTHLEKHFKDIQDFEFTVQENKLYMLQTRSGKRTGQAAVKIAVDLVEEGITNEEESLMRVEPNALNQLLHPIFKQEDKEKHEKLSEGLPASPGAASGQVVFSADDAVAWNEKGKSVVLVREETSPDDIHGMSASRGILTATGGMTSHAAVVGRQMGKPAIVGCGAIHINENKKLFKVNQSSIQEGDWISIDGASGEIFVGQIQTKPSEIIQVVRGEIKPESSEIYMSFSKLMTWSDKIRKMKIRANADTPEDARMASAFGAEGIGLARTEHMFFEKDRLPHIKAMILAETKAERIEHLNKLLPFQKKDFYELFKSMQGNPVTVRTLDPPLHEFLPKKEDLMVEIAELKVSKDRDPGKIKELEQLLERVRTLSEFNPMLGHRGCRLGITYPEITEMQAKAIFEAACQLVKEGKKVLPEIMVPLIGNVKELSLQKKIIIETAGEIMAKNNVKVDYLVGTMIEIPRAAITAGKVAEEADFFSFGTNDLTQTTFGISRDDGANFINHYLTHGIWPDDPFTTVDIAGVGELMKWTVEKGRETSPKLKIGICGVHGGDPRSIEFCEKIGLNYVSCSAYQVPIARLSAAQSTLRKK